MASKMSRKVGTVALAACIATSLYFPVNANNLNNIETNNLTSLTGAEQSNDPVFSAYLEELENATDITFTNKELYEFLYEYFNGPFTIQDLKSIKTLKINRTFNNQDLSDLQYLTNLKNLIITESNTIDCNDLKYNQKLKYLYLSSCTLINTEELPNTLNEIALSKTDIADDILVLPYHIKELKLYSTTFNKLQFKNPSSISKIVFNGYGFIDIDDLINCANLKELSINQCPNVLNAEKLSFMSNTNIELDEFCTLWLNSNQIKQISTLSPESKEYYANISNQLDYIANSLVTPDMSEEEKINTIILYVINTIEYDTAALEDTEEGDKLLTNYNSDPLYYALNYNDGVCVGYATLFTALANRVGIDSYQPDSFNHTWNMIRQIGEERYGAYDLTALDNKYAAIKENDQVYSDQYHNSAYYIEMGEEDRLYYYDFNLNEVNSTSYETNIENIDVPERDFAVGYLYTETNEQETPKTEISEKSEKKETHKRLNIPQFVLLSLGFSAILHLLLSNAFKKNNKPKKTKKYQPTEKQIVKYKRNM